MRINGVEKSGYEGCSVKEMLVGEEFEIHRVAVEINEQILPKDQYENTVLHGDDVIEVVSFMGGGCAESEEGKL